MIDYSVTQSLGKQMLQRWGVRVGRFEEKQTEKKKETDAQTIVDGNRRFKLVEFPRTPLQPDPPS